MKRLHLLIILVALLSNSCQKQQRNDKLEEKEIEIKVISQQVDNNINDVEISNDLIETFIDIKTLYPGKVVVEKRDVNLDVDTAIEQFIILIDELNLVTLVAVDFNKITREYFVAWEVALPFIFNSDFLMTEQDVLASKHNLELVISGTTINNNNGLYIYRKSAPPKGLHIYYKPVFTKESSGTIEIVQISRSLDYIESKKESDQAFDISLEKTNIIDENTVSIIKENWAWDKRRNTYIKESSEATEQKINVKEKLRTIFEGSKTNFLKYITGEWLLSNDNSSDERIMIIDANNSKVILKYNDGVEEYNIYRSRTNYQRITLYMKNSDVTTIPKQFIITLKSTDMFSITNNTPSFWDGEYTRLNYETKHKLISDLNTDIKKDVPFTGIYKNVAYTLNFAYPEYKKINSVDGTIEEGVFSLLELSNSLVIQFKAKGELRADYKTTNYELTYTEQKLESQAIRTIRIHEGLLTTHGIELKPDASPIKFEQTEVMNNEQ